MARLDQVHACVVDYRTMDLAVQSARLLADWVGAVSIVNNGGVAWSGPWPLKVAHVRPASNLGYGGAANLITQSTDRRWLLLLNADASIRPDALKVLLQGALTAQAVVSGPQLYLDDELNIVLPPALPFDEQTYATLNRRWHSKEAWGRAERMYLDRHQAMRTAAAPMPMGALSGACLLIDLDWFKDRAEPVFDPRFFLYYEETDLCRRVSAGGAPPILVPMAKAVHRWDRSPDPDGRDKAEWMRRSERLYREKHRIDPGGAVAVKDSRRFRAESVWSEETKIHARAIDASLDSGFSQFLTVPADGAAAVVARLSPHRVYLRDREADSWQYMVANV